jgi:hypothetical protein
MNEFLTPNDVSIRTSFKIAAEAGSIYVAPDDLSGRPAAEALALAQGDAEAVRAGLAAGLFLPLELLQEDGFAGRVVLGPLTPAEADEWIVQTAWNLDVRCGRVAIGADLSAIERRLNIGAEAAFADRVCVVDVPPGEYCVTVYGYLPGSAVAVWREEHDEPIGSWFRRTRPPCELERWPPWLILWCADEEDPGFEDEWDAFFEAHDYNDLRARIGDYVEYLFHFTPARPSPPPNTASGYLPWRTRKPKKCPLGVPLAS